MDVVDFLEVLRFGCDVAVVATAGLPESGPGPVLRETIEDRRIERAPSFDHASPERAFHPAENLCNGFSGGCRTKQEMDVLGHDHPRKQLEAEGSLSKGEMVDEGVLDSIVLKERELAVTGAREVTSMAFVFDAMQCAPDRHGGTVTCRHSAHSTRSEQRAAVWHPTWRSELGAGLTIRTHHPPKAAG